MPYVYKFKGGRFETGDIHVVEEMPLALMVNGVELATLMATRRLASASGSAPGPSLPCALTLQPPLELATRQSAGPSSRAPS